MQHAVGTTLTTNPCAQDEAKDAFKELLAAVQVSSDWSWDKAMRHIIGDPRYICSLFLPLLLPTPDERAALQFALPYEFCKQLC